MWKMFLTLLFVLDYSLVLAQNSKTDSLLELHFEEAGNRSQWKALKSYVVEDSSFFAPAFKPPHERSLGDESYGYTKTYYQSPNQYRIEYYENKELHDTFIVDKKRAESYRYDASLTQPLPDHARKYILFHQAFSIVGVTPYILRALNKGTIKYNGVIEAYGKTCDMLVLDFENPIAIGKLKVYLDTTTHLAHAAAFDGKVDRYRLFTDYHNVEGLMIPHYSASYVKGALSEEDKMIDIKVNQPMDDQLFEVW